MITLTGTLRQSGEMSFKDDNGKDKPPVVKLWVEHETPRENGPGDLKIEELFVDKTAGLVIPKNGEKISLNVRCYPSGRDIKFQALNILTGGPVKP